MVWLVWMLEIYAIRSHDTWLSRYGNVPHLWNERKITQPSLLIALWCLQQFRTNVSNLMECQLLFTVGKKRVVSIDRLKSTGTFHKELKPLKLGTDKEKEIGLIHFFILFWMGHFQSGPYKTGMKRSDTRLSFFLLYGQRVSY